MRKGLIAVGIIVLMVGLASSLQAGGIINKQNLSADYIRTLNRNAATDMADAAAFNPAGTAMMQDGLYLKADAIYLWKDYSNQTAVRPPPSLTWGRLTRRSRPLFPGFLRSTSKTAGPSFSVSPFLAAAARCDINDGDSRTVLVGRQGLCLVLSATPTSGQQYIEADSYYVGYSLGRSLQDF